MIAFDDILGYIGGGILSFQLIPQIYKVQKENLLQICLFSFYSSTLLV